MKALAMFLGTVLVGTSAHASTYAVEFWPCSSNDQIICARVFNGVAPQELPIQANNDILIKINQSMNALGHSLATNISGEIEPVHKVFGGMFYRLQVESLTSTSNSRPRGF